MCLLTLSACLSTLHNLQMTHCKVKTVEDLEHLIECEELSVVDLAHNKLSDPAIIDVFEKMKNLVSSDLFFKYLFFICENSERNAYTIVNLKSLQKVASHIY